MEPIKVCIHRRRSRTRGTNPVLLRLGGSGLYVAGLGMIKVIVSQLRINTKKHPQTQYA